MAERVARLPLLNLLLYTSDMIGSQAIAQTRNLWLLFFLVPPRESGQSSAIPGMLLGPIDVDPRVFIGLLLTVGRFLEALDDPIIGWWSDRTRSCWGRRIPFVLFATPFYSLLFVLLWFTPWGNDHFGNAIYVFVILELFFLCNTLSGGPYESLLPEIAKTQEDRMRVVASQFYFGILGAVLGLVLTGVIGDLFGFKIVGLVVGAAGLAFRYLGLAGIWNHAPRETPAARIGLKAAFTATLRNKQFLHFVPSFVFFQLSVSMVIAWLPFFVKQVLQVEDEGGVTSLLTGAALAGMFISVFFLWWLSAARGKQWVYSVCLLGTAVYLPFLFLAGFLPVIPKIVQGLIMALAAGFPMAGVNLLPRAITADITDYDELLTGMRREGMFYATQNLFEKLGSSFSTLLLSLVLLMGETTDNPLGIRMVGPISGAAAFVGYWFFRGYQLPDAITAETVGAAGLAVPLGSRESKQ